MVDFRGAFHSTKNSEISGPKLNGTVKIPGKVFENLGIRFECTLFDGISGIIENFVFHSQKMSGLVSLTSIGDRTIRSPVCHTPKEQQYLFFWQYCGPPRWIASWIPPSVLNNWHISQVIRKWFSNSPNKYAGIDTSSTHLHELIPSA